MDGDGSGGGGGGGGKQEQFHFTKEELRDLFSFNDSAECDTHDLLDCHCEDGREKGTTKETGGDGGNARDCQLGGDEDPGERSRRAAAAAREEGNGRAATAAAAAGGGGGRIRDLLRWEHLRPLPGLFPDDPCLAEVVTRGDQGAVSFVFRNVRSQ